MPTRPQKKRAPNTQPRIRPAYHALYDTRWRTARSVFLARHPLCRHCEQSGRTVSADVVDHIQPHKGDHELFWDQTNWQALCKSCHDTKTARYDRY